MLHSAGEWLRQYGFAVYGCAPNPFPHPFAWGYVTVERREGADTRLHLILRNWQPELRLNGLRKEPCLPGLDIEPPVWSLMCRSGKRADWSCIRRNG